MITPPLLPVVHGGPTTQLSVNFFCDPVLQTIVVLHPARANLSVTESFLASASHPVNRDEHATAGHRDVL